tara:strand:+ start:408 stop:1205 length:798 start_codon:yes stop_codon:yes gene_type:complete
MKIIAEVGWNHLGDMKLAREMIDAASNAGADYCKFQTWSVKNLKPGPWDKDGRREIYQKAELTYEKHIELKEYCDNRNIKFLTTIFNINDLEFLKKLIPDIIKIGSPEAYNLELIAECLNNFKNVIVSTGATKWEEINQYKKLNNLNRLILLHCVSAYPCKPENINIPRMNKLREITNCVGYSGHFDGIDDAIIAICNNAEFVEKHFTIDKSLPGRDNQFALMPNQLKKICEFRDNFKKMNKFKGLDFQNIEEDVVNGARGRWKK